MTVTTTSSKSTSPEPQLSLLERLDFVPAVLSLAATALWAACTGLWRGENQARTLPLHIGYAVMRKSTVRLTSKQLQYIVPSTNKMYDAFIRKTRHASQTVDLGHGALGHWIGDPGAENVLVWFHGGGFALPASRGYFEFFSRIVEDMLAAGKSVAIFGLTYTLTPHARYPTQLRQAVEAVRYVLEKNKTPGHKPHKVFLGGDSAGGNLVGGVLSHITHPHPQIQTLGLPPSEKLGGAVMIAPWTLLDTDFRDREIDSGGDIIVPDVAKPWATAYLGTSKRDNYTDLSTAPTDWYAGFRVNSLLVLAGSNEIMLPVIEDFASKLKKGFPNTELFVGKRECHVAPVYNLDIGDQTETEQGKKLKEWLRELLSP